eukprot:6058577-Prymnesium_polylepis.2
MYSTHSTTASAVARGTMQYDTEQYSAVTCKLHETSPHRALVCPAPRGGPAYPFWQASFRPNGHDDGWNRRSLAFAPVTVREAATSAGAWRRPLSMPPPRSRPHRSSPRQLAGIGDAGERRAATTRPRWSSSTGARRGDHPVAHPDYLGYLGNFDGRDTIIDSILSSNDQPLRAARGA